jgi:putative membrane protein
VKGSPAPPIASGIAAAGFGVAAAAMIATPLLRRGRRRLAASAVVTGLATATLSLASRRWGTTRAAGAFATVAAATTALERVGSSSGRPFGRYHYSSALRPSLVGVPAIVPAAWFAMALPARETAHAVLGARSTPATRIALGAAALTAWDLFLDPQMVGEGYWRWERQGRYRGIPLTNYAGWLVAGAGLMALLELVAPAAPSVDRALVGLYSWVAVMETVGFAAFFDDRLVAAVGGLAMVPLAAVAARRTFGAR